MTSTSSPPWRRRVAYVAGAIVVSLAMLEVGLRLLALIFAEGNVAAARATDQAEREPYTIVCVGDSWTRGQPSGSYPDVLQKKLHDLAGDDRYRVVNLGASGTNSTQSVLRLAEALPVYRPRMAIVLTGNNDHWNLSESAYWRFADPQHRPGLLVPKTRVMLHSLRIYRLGRLAYCLLTGLNSPSRFFYLEHDELAQTRALTAVDPETHRAQLTFNLIKLIELTRVDGVHLVLQTYFHFHGYRVNEVIADVAAAHDIPLVNNTVLFHTEIPPLSRNQYLIADGHPSPLGYEFMADKVIEVIQEHALLPR